jgi:ABC-type transport system involved in cytochrome c biogenesis permease subunit
MEAILPVRFIVLTLYFGAAATYIVLLRSGSKKKPVLPWLLGVGLGLHFVEVMARGAESGTAGGAPFVNLSGFLSIYAFLLGLTYFVLERRFSRFRIHSLGAFHVPVVFVLHAWSAFLKQPIAEIPEINTGWLFIAHVVPAIFAYASLTVAFVAAVAYLFLDHQLRLKHTGVLMRGLPNLDLVERVNAATVKIGTPLLLISIVVGMIMGRSEPDVGFFWDPKVWISVVTLIIFSSQIVLRELAGWTGRRSVMMTLVGFLAIFIGATLVNLYFPGFHGVG